MPFSLLGVSWELSFLVRETLQGGTFPFWVEMLNGLEGCPVMHLLDNWKERNMIVFSNLMFLKPMGKKKNLLFVICGLGFGGVCRRGYI